MPFDKDTTAYYFDFGKEEMVKIKKQRKTDNALRITIDGDESVYVLDKNIFEQSIFDYGKIEDTPEYAEQYVMPWPYEGENIETKNDDSTKVIDSGFRFKHHAFPFSNLLTTTGDEGVLFKLDFLG